MFSSFSATSTWGRNGSPVLTKIFFQLGDDYYHQLEIGLASTHIPMDHNWGNGQDMSSEQNPGHLLYLYLYIFINIHPCYLVFFCG